MKSRFFNDKVSLNITVGRKSNERFINEYNEDEEMSRLLRTVFLDLAEKICKLMKPFVSLAKENNFKIDPTNVNIERAFGIMQYFEEKYMNS